LIREDFMTAFHFRTSLCCAVAVCALAGATLSAQQPQVFQFVVSATDASGMPVTDLKPEEVVMTENGMPAKVVKLEPFSLPLKVTIAVDNGPDSREAIAHIRNGLKGFVEAFPVNVEMTLIATAPQPRMVVRPTADRAQMLRGLNGFAPEDEAPRFTDSLVEWAERLERELRDKKITMTNNYLPVLMSVSTTAPEVTSVQREGIEKAFKFIAARGAKVYVTMTSTRTGDATAAADINTNRQALIAIPIVKATGGRYEAIAVSSRLATLLPEIGQQLASLHVRQATQFLVTVERAAGITGQLQNPQVQVTRPGLKGAVSLDGRLP
jgi:hypothetical protein